MSFKHIVQVNFDIPISLDLDFEIVPLVCRSYGIHMKNRLVRAKFYATTFFLIPITYIDNRIDIWTSLSEQELVEALYREILLKEIQFLPIQLWTEYIAYLIHTCYLLSSLILQLILFKLCRIYSALNDMMLYITHHQIIDIMRNVKSRNNILTRNVKIFVRRRCLW